MFFAVLAACVSYTDRLRRSGCESTRRTSAQPVVVKAPKEQTIEHVANFLDCVKTRKLPNGDVWIGHRSAQASHFANIAYLQKRRMMFDPDWEEMLPL